MMFLHAVKTE